MGTEQDQLVTTDPLWPFEAVIIALRSSFGSKFTPKKYRDILPFGVKTMKPLGWAYSSPPDHTETEIRFLRELRDGLFVAGEEMPAHGRPGRP